MAAAPGLDPGGTPGRLPDRVPPMLAKIGQPFDSPEHLFEVKWDGVRAVAMVEGDGWRMHSRHRGDLAGRYPELDCLRGLPPGVALDGELVVLGPDGKPDFRAALAREAARGARVAQAAQRHRSTYVVFDLLYQDFVPLLDRPLRERRVRLQDLIADLGELAVTCPEGVQGEGQRLFAAVTAQGLEGMVAKRLDSRYRPGERSDAWLKVKPVRRLLCLVLGYEPDGERDFKSLIIASNEPEGVLRCVGKVGTGFDARTRAELRERLFQARRSVPLIDAGMTGCWVEPGLYVSVSFLEWTAHGNLRGPVFTGVVDDG